MKITRAKIHETCYFVFLIGLAIGVPVSTFMMSMFTIFLLANWLIEGNFREKFGNKQQNLITLCFIVPYVVHLLWMLNTSDTAFGIDDLRRKMPLLVIPLVIFTSKVLSLRKYRTILSVYVICILTASVYAFVNYSMKDGVEYRDMVTFTSHIRFSLNICMAICILFVEIVRMFRQKPKGYKCISLVFLFFIFYFLVFLTVLRSFTAFGILFLISSITVLYCLFSKQITSKTKRWVGISFFVILFLFVGYETYIIKDYYVPREISAEPLKEYTKNGNKYTHAQNGFIENGYFIDDYVSEQEIRETWKDSYRSLDESTDNGNNMYATLIRYLNSKGLTKDAEGVSMLSEKDIQNITYGYANYYSAQKLNPRNPTYQLLFELDMYRNGGYYLHSSSLQRLHLWQNGLQIIKRNPLFGVGTGDVASEIKHQLETTDSLLKDSSIRTHNQYLTFVLSFGIIGFLLIFLSYFYIIKQTKVKGHFLFLSFLMILLVSMVSEDTLETQAGVTLFSFFFAFLVRMKDYDKVSVAKFLEVKGER